MLLLILITIALVIASSFLVLIMHRAFERGISWFDERSIVREQTFSKLERTQEQSANPTSAATPAAKASSTEDEQEWAEFIEM